MSEKKEFPVRKGKKPPGEISPDQYRVGLEQARSGATVGRIVTATGMTKAQVRWCAIVGNQDMPPWAGVLEREACLLRAQSLEIAKSAGTKALALVEGGMDIAAQAQDQLRITLGLHRHALNQQVQKARAEGEEIDISDLAMPAGVRETCKVLMKATDLTSTMRTISTIMGTANDLVMKFRAPGDSKEAREALDREALIPALVSLTEGRHKEAGGGDLDPLETLMGDDLERWNENDLQAYLEKDRSKYSDVLDVTEKKEDLDDDF